MEKIVLTPREGESLPANLGLAAGRGIDTNLKVFSPDEALAEFTERFPKIIALFELVGIHPTKSDIPHNPYTNQPATESFTNIGEHCLAVGYAASKMMDALVAAGVAKAEDADAVIERALVHDITKPYEIMRRDAKRMGLAEEVYSVSAYDQLQPLLVKAGVPEDLADYLVQAGKETGHNSLRDFVAVDGTEVTGIIPGKVADKIVHLADDMTFTSTPLKEGDAPVTLFLTPWERMLASRFVEKYAFMWKEGLGVNKSGEVVTVPDVNSPKDGVNVVGDYTALQVKVAGAIAREFQLFLEPGSTQEPEQFIKSLVNG